jgi:hypothetical protein
MIREPVVMETRRVAIDDQLDETKYTPKGLERIWELTLSYFIHGDPQTPYI